MYADRRLRRSIRQPLNINAVQDEKLARLTEITGGERGAIAWEIFDRALEQAIHAAECASRSTQVRVPLRNLLAA